MRQRNRVLIMDALTWLIMGIALIINQLLLSPMISIESGSDYMTRVFGKGSGRGSWRRNPGAQIVCAQTSTRQQQTLIISIHTAATAHYFSKDHSNPSAIHVTPRKLWKRLRGGVARMFVLWELQARWASNVKNIPNVRISGLIDHAG